ncbi:alpha/beta-type small acid-soluble spore protein [Camelliibacillus cellulosilyticus]|uniref:Alpha/beta-type small acid-soluble spore protein n=1 Tax=Camelliibacillus cellulosilyticus TaxID=2174486 RepID=A0ABV9GGK6_9BACL
MASKKDTMKKLEEHVMTSQGYRVDPNQPEDVKYEVASSVGIPLKKGDNGDLAAKDAGKIGGNIGGPMVREMIKLAEQNLRKRPT